MHSKRSIFKGAKVIVNKDVCGKGMPAGPGVHILGYIKSTAGNTGKPNILGWVYDGGRLHRVIKYACRWAARRHARRIAYYFERIYGAGPSICFIINSACTR